jgi:DNA repair exonuclease SbcCD ATPase subunit
VHSAVSRGEVEANFTTASILATGIKDRLRSRVTQSSTAAGVLRRRLEEAWERTTTLQDQVTQREKQLHEAAERERALQRELKRAETHIARLRAARSKGRKSLEQHEKECFARWGVEKQTLQAKVALLESSFASCDVSRLEESSFLPPADFEEYRSEMEALRAQLENYKQTRDEEVASLKAQLEEKSSLMECKLREAGGWLV